MSRNEVRAMDGWRIAAYLIIIVAGIIFNIWVWRGGIRNVQNIRRLHRETVAIEQGDGPPHIIGNEGMWDVYSDGIRRPSRAFIDYYNSIVRAGRQVSHEDLHGFTVYEMHQDEQEAR